MLQTDQMKDIENKDSSKIPIYLPIEAKEREIEGKLLLALHLISDGFPVIIGDKGGIFRELKYLNKCIYIAKSLSIDYLETFKYIKRNNGKIIVLFEEGGIVAWEKYKYEEISSFYPQSMLKYINYLFTYGSTYKHILINHDKELNEANTYVSGNSRFDLHKPKYRQYYSNSISTIQKKYGKYILIDTNFSMGNHIFGDEYIRAELLNNKDFSDELKKVYLKLIDSQKEILNIYIKSTKNIAEEFPEYSIIVRPHPGEKPDIYKNHLNNINNLYVTNDGIAAPWIWGSEILIHHDCTTSVEAYFSGKTAISYTPCKNNGAISWLPLYISDRVNSESELLSKLNSYLRMGKTFELEEEKKKHLYQNLINFKKESAKLIVEKINKISETENNKNMINDYFSIKYIDYCKRFYKRIRNHLGWYRRKYFRKCDIYSFAFKGLSKRELNLILNKFKKIEDMNFEFDIKRLGINTFLIRKIGQ